MLPLSYLLNSTTGIFLSSPAVKLEAFFSLALHKCGVCGFRMWPCVDCESKQQEGASTAKTHLGSGVKYYLDKYLIHSPINVLLHYFYYFIFTV